MAMVIAASVLWSLSGIAVKRAGMDPAAFTFYRSLSAAAVMLLPALLGAGRRPPAIWTGFTAVVYTCVVFPFVASMTLGTAASGILLQYTAPVFCALLAWLTQKRAISRRTFAAMIIATAGIAIMFLSAPHGRSIAGPALGLFSGVAFAVLILTLEKIDRVCGRGANLYWIILMNNAGVCILLLPLLLIQGTLRPEKWQAGLAACTGVVQLAIPYVLFQLGLRRVHPVDAALLSLLEPVLNPLWVAAFHGELPDAGTYAGGSAILVALIIEATKDAKHAAGDSSPAEPGLTVQAAPPRATSPDRRGGV